VSDVGAAPPARASRFQFFVLTRFRTGHLLGCAVRCAVAAAGLACIPASASSCRKDVTAPIQMPAGQSCWAYRGAATSFIGEFRVGAAVSAR
jgi:hypothetical protein